MPFAGLDVHKRVVEAVVLDHHGKVVLRDRFDCTREQLERFAKSKLGRKCSVALEATTNTWAIVSTIKPFVKEVVVSNPLRTRAIAEAKIKTDKVDALVLAQLLRTDFLPRVWEPDEHTQRVRRLTNRRASLVHDRTRVKNRIHAVLHQRLIHVPKGNLFSAPQLRWLRELALDDAGREALDSELRLLSSTEAEIQRAHEELVGIAYQDERVKLLMTLPGVDVAVAQTLLSTLGDITRFKDGDHAASYIGLVPSTRQSADRSYHGSITKQGRSQARWLLVQAAQHLASHPGPLGVFFRKLCQKKDRNVAVVATARKLVVVAYHMLKNNEPYRYADPRSLEGKLARLRIAATGERRQGGVPKGVKPATRPGHGPSRRVPPLAELLEREGLPSTKTLAAGEKKMLREKKIVRAVAQFHKERILPRGRRPAGEHSDPESTPKSAKGRKSSLGG